MELVWRQMPEVQLEGAEEENNRVRRGEPEEEWHGGVQKERVEDWFRKVQRNRQEEELLLRRRQVRREEDEEEREMDACYLRLEYMSGDCAECDLGIRSLIAEQNALLNILGMQKREFACKFC